MKYIVTEEVNNGLQYARPVGCDDIALNYQGPKIVHNKEIGQYLVQNSEWELVPENKSDPMLHKMVCIGADIIPISTDLYKKHLVLFGKHIGDIHYDVYADSVFFPVQIGHELLVYRPNEIKSNKRNYGFRIVQNLTIDKMRKDFLTKQL